MSSSSAITAQEVYRMADEIVGHLLQQEGFERAQEGEYLRHSAEGLDRVMLDADDRKKKVSVLASHYPKDLAFMDDFLRGEDRGFPVGPYVSARGMSSRPHAWSYTTREQAAKSLADINEALVRVTLPWMRELRTPRTYADAVDDNALLYKGAAYERAGDLAGARRAYEAMFDRFRQMLAQFDESLVMKEAGEQFIYLAEKLGREKAVADRFREHLRYTRPVVPLLAHDGRHS